jgi:hypothetical protein
MNSILDELRGALGPPPRSFGFFEYLWLKARAPFYLRRNDDLMEIYKRQGLLLRKGRVVWGALVQANSLLFNRGLLDHPAMTIHSTDPSFDGAPDELLAIARGLFDLKNTTPNDPSQRRLAKMITNEMERGMGWTVPKSCTGGREVSSTTFMVFRKHIPGRALRCSWFPLLTHPKTPAVMIVPKRYWPSDLVRIWMDGEEVA